MNENKLKWPDSIVVVIPAYFAENSLRLLLPKVLEYVPSSKIIVVNDGSTDNTDQICQEKNILVLKHESNKGKGAALRTAFQHVKKLDGIEAIITLDADGQHDPKNINTFIEKFRENPEVSMIIGSRKRELGSMPALRIFSNSVTSFILTKITKQKIMDSQCGYRLYSSKFIQNISINYNGFEMESEVIFKASFLNMPIIFTTISTIYESKQSHISHLRDTYRWVKMVLKLWLFK